MRQRLLNLAILLALWLMIPWSANATVYLSEDFETLASGIPDGWDNTKGTATGSARWTKTDDGDNVCLSFNASSKYTNILQTPVLSFSSEATLYFRCKTNKSTGADGGKFMVCVTTDDASTFIDTLQTVAFTDKWVEYQCPLAAYKGMSGLRVAFCSEGSGKFNAKQYLDSIVVSAPTLCAAPQGLSVMSVTQSSAMLFWSLEEGAVANPSKYQLYVENVTDGAVVHNNVLITSSATMHTLDNLTPGKEYKVSLKGDCFDAEPSQGYSEPSDTVVFKTPANPVDLTYEEHFNADASAVPADIISFGDVSVHTVHRGDGGYSVQLMPSGDGATRIVLPPMNHPAGDMQFTAWFYGNANSSIFTIGLTSDPYNPSEIFELLVDTIRVSSQWTEVRVQSKNYPDNTTGKSFVITVPAGAKGAVKVDDIKIEQTPTCLRPEDLAVSEIDSSSVRLSWTDLSAVTDRVVRIVSSSGTVYRRVTANPALVGNLESNTEYEIAVCARCSDSDSSEWSQPILFSTLCGVAANTLFTQGFEEITTLPECWTQYQSVKADNPSSSGTDKGDKLWARSTSKKHDGGASMSMPYTKKGIHTLLISQPVHIDKSGKYDVAFWMYRNSSTPKPGEGITLWISNTRDTVGAQKYKFIQGSYKLEPVEDKGDEWYRYECNIQREGTVYIIFEGISQYGSTLYIDDVELYPAPSCRKPDVKSVVFDKPAAESLTMNWSKAVAEPQWIVRYTLTKTGAELVKTDTVVTDSPTFKFDNLSPATEYTVTGELAALCGVGDTSEFVPFTHSFITLCVPLPVPFVQSFESVAFPPPCWNMTPAGKSWVKNTAAQYVSEGAASAKYSKTTSAEHAFLVSPEITIPEADKYQVSFSMYRYDGTTDSNEGVRVWVNATPDTVDAVELAYIRTSKDIAPQEHAAGMYEYAAPVSVAGNRYVIFEGISSNEKDIYIDDIRVEEKPACADMRSFYVDSVGADTAIVKLYYPVDGEWEVEYGFKGYAHGYGTVATASSSSGTVLHGLTSDTWYDVYIRRVCGEERSEWSDAPQTFRTECRVFEPTADNEYYDGFEQYTLSTDLSTASCYSQQPADGGTVKAYTVVERYADYNNVVKILPNNGKQFAAAQYSNNSFLFRAMKLRAGVNYEVSGYFAQDGTDATSTQASIVLATSPSAADVVQHIVKDAVVINEWKQIAGYFTVEKDGIYYLGWGMKQSWSGSRNAMDDIRLREVQCVPPARVAVTPVGSDSAVFQWVSDAKEFDLKITLTDAGGDATSGVVFTEHVTNLGKTVKGLDANTEYYYYIRSYCDDTPSEWLSGKFRTICGVFEIPFVEGFEDAGWDADNCWHIIGENAVCTRDVSRYNTGKASLKLKGTVVSPELKVDDLASYVMSGYVFTQTPGDTIVIGMAEEQESPDDVAREINLTSTGRWERFEVDFTLLSEADYADYNPKFVSIITTGESEIYLDDIRVEPKPSCLAPSASSVSNITASSFDLAWTSHGEEKEWKVSLMRAGRLVVDTVVKNNPCTVSGLQQNTEYIVYLRAICGAGDTSAILDCGNVLTDCGTTYLPYKLPSLEPYFESLPSCWTVSPESKESWRVDRECEGNRCVYFLVYDDYGSSASQSLQSPIFDLSGSITSATLKIGVENGSTKPMYLRLSKDGGKTFDVELDTIDRKTGVQNLVYNLTPYVGDTVVLHFDANGADYGSYSKLCSFELDMTETCQRPVNVKSVSVTPESLVVEIDDTVAAHNAWQMVCVYPSVYPDEVEPVDVLGGKQHTINNLHPNTMYHVYVRSVCGGTDKSSWAGPFEFTTPCGEEAIPYTESFEDYTTSTISSACFTFINRKEDTAQPRAVIDETDYVSDGMRGLQLISTKDEYVYYVLPEMADALNTLKIRFDYRNGSTDDPNTLTVGLMSTNTNATTFVPVESLVTSGEFTTHTIAFDTVTDAVSNNYIVFRYGNASSDGRVGVDNIRVTSLSVCPSIDDIMASSIGPDSAVITIVPEHKVARFEVVYDIAGTVADDCANKVEVTGNRVTLGDLDKASSYYVYARAVCGKGDTAAWSAPLMFSTQCDEIVLDENTVWKENFDSYEDMILPFPPCFTRIKTEIANGEEYPVLSKENAVTHPYCLHLSGDNMVALPAFELDADRLILSFNAKGSGVLYVAMSDELRPDGPKVAEQLKSVNGESKRYEYDLSMSGKEGRYILVYTKDADVYIDSMEVKMAPTCHEPRNLTVSAVLDTSAVITWSEVPDAVDYTYRLTSAVTDTVVMRHTGNMLSLGNLNEDTKYTIEVCALCTQTDSTLWSAKKEFTTAVASARVPYLATFENSVDNVSWVLLNASAYVDRFVTGQDVKAVKDGVRALYVTNDGTYSHEGAGKTGDEYNDEILYAYRTVYLERGAYRLSYDWKGEGYGSDYAPNNYGRVFFMPLDISLNTGDKTVFAQSLSDNRYIVVGDKLFGKDTWQTVSDEVEIAETGIYRLVVGWYQSFESDGKKPLTVDNMCIEQVECSRIEKAIAEYTESTTALIRFVNNTAGAKTECRLMLGTTQVSVDTVTGDSILLSNLLPDTQYNLLLKSMCSDVALSEAISCEFSTECEPITVTADNPFIDGFEEYDTDRSRLISCWKLSDKDAPWYVRTTSDTDGRAPYQGSNYVTLYITNGTMARDFELEAGKDYSISVMTKNAIPEGSTVSLIVDNGVNDSVLIKQPVVKNYDKLYAEFTAPVTGVYRIGVRGELASGSSYLCVDSFEVAMIAISRPIDFTVSSVTATGASFSWRGSGSSYRLQILDGDNVVIDSLITGATAYLTNSLFASTPYKARVRNEAGNVYSEWIQKDFNTLCGVRKLPYCHDFNLLSEGAVPVCWDNHTYTSTSGEVYWATYNLDGNMVMRLRTDNTKGKHVLITTPFSVESKGYNLRFDYAVDSDNDTLTVVVGTYTASSGISFGDTILVKGKIGRQTMGFRLAEYVGKDVVIAFINENTSGKGQDKKMYIDDFAIEALADDVLRYDTICPGDSYSYPGFNIDRYAIAKPGDYTFERYVRPTVAGGESGYYELLNIHVKRGGSYTIMDTICEGDSYPVSEAFPTPLTTPGVHFGKVTSSDGCDSIITLHLTVQNPRIDIRDTICEGQSVVFADSVYTETGVYHDTLTTVAGCDSICTLTLTVLPKYFENTKVVCPGKTYTWHVGGRDTVLTTTGRYERVFENMLGCDSVEVLHFTVLPDTVYIDSTICQGRSVLFGTQQRTVSGIYIEHFNGSFGCDSIVKLTLTVEAPVEIELNDYACEGYPYVGNGYNNLIITKDTVCLRTIKDPESGCETVEKLNLRFVPTVVVDTVVTINEGDSYLFCGNSETEPGIYTCTSKTSDGCDSITHLTLVVKTGVDNLSVKPLVLAPNPIGVGEVTYIHRTWTAEEQQGMTVEVINSLGKVLMSDTPDSYPIAINSPDVSGVYYIRITTGTGEIYIGRLIVK